MSSSATQSHGLNGSNVRYARSTGTRWLIGLPPFANDPSYHPPEKVRWPVKISCGSIRVTYMPFNAQQNSHQKLRSIVAEKTSKFVCWVGSGLSADANLPTWPQLKKRLVKQLREKANDISDTDSRSLQAAADSAEREENYWIAFQILRRNLGPSTYRSAIREALLPALTADCPKAYHYIWRLGVSGVLNLNLDRLATKALGEVFPGRLPTEFSGRDAGRFLHSLKSPHPFVANLHGIGDDESTWIFTRRDLKDLLRSEGYKTFIRSCLATTTTLFLGISADDIAAGGHIAALTQAGIDTGPHYWLTNRVDLKTDTWAEQAGIQIIRYHNHSEIIEFFEDILCFVPDDGPSPPPVVLEHLSEEQETRLPSAGELLQLEAEKIRGILNTHAKQLLSTESSDSYSKYEEFSADYDEVIYRAWYTSVSVPSNKLLGFTLLEEVAHGAFGRVYRASGPDGNQVAIKVLLEEIRRDPVLLRSFRRGVRSMRFLMRRNVAGMVAYKEASEIPAFAVMDWVDGPTLSEAQEARQIDDWGSILKIGLQMTDVIRRAHAIPERVLHRDIRPSNIMLEGFYSRPDNWRVVVLDFDLSWHQGALEQSVIHGALFGYLAPEQIEATPEASTRHAAVDSFGAGMTLYFMIAGKDPLPAQHRHHDWGKTVQAAALCRDSASWISLPYRYSRLITKATEDSQANRWDMAQIKDEIERLSNAFLNPSAVVSAELLAEEIAARSGRDYDWNDDMAMAVIQLVSGASIRITGNESDRLVVVNLNWNSRGKQERKQVGKWMAPATDRCVKVLKASGWQIRTKNIQPPQSMVLEATLAVTRAATTLKEQAHVVSTVAEELNFE